MINIDTLIASALKEQKKDELSTLRLIKKEFLDKKTEPKRKTKELTDDEELAILLKMATVRKDAIEIYRKNNRNDLADIELAELHVIEKFLPKLASDEEIAAHAKIVIENFIKEKGEDFKLSMANMPDILKEVKKTYPKEKNSGKVVSMLLKTYL